MEFQLSQGTARCGQEGTFGGQDTSSRGGCHEFWLLFLGRAPSPSRGESCLSLAATRGRVAEGTKGGCSGEPTQGSGEREQLRDPPATGGVPSAAPGPPSPQSRTSAGAGGTARAAGSAELVPSTGCRLLKASQPAACLPPPFQPFLLLQGCRRGCWGRKADGGWWLVHLLLVCYRARAGCSTRFHWLSRLVSYGKEPCSGDMIFPIYSVWIGKLVSLFLN